MWNWYYYNWLCGDHICEQHIHNLDVGNWVKQAYPVTAHGMGGRQVRTDKRYGEIYDHHAVEYHLRRRHEDVQPVPPHPGCWSASRNTATARRESSTRLNPKAAGQGSPQSAITSSPAARERPYQVEHDDLFKAIREATRTTRPSTGR